MLTGPLEPTNEPYAIAKIAGIKMVEAYRSQYGSDFINVMPTNLYGPGDNYHPEYSHVVAALIRRFHEAKVSGAAECRGLGHRHAAARIPLCRRSRRCLHPSDEELIPATNWSISAPARTSPSPNSRAWSPPPSAMPARSASIPRGPTARRANCSMSAGSPNWAGARAPRWRTASGSPIRRISAKHCKLRLRGKIHRRSPAARGLQQSSRDRSSAASRPVRPPQPAELLRAGRPAHDANDDCAIVLVFEHRRAGIAGAGAEAVAGVVGRGIHQAQLELAGLAGGDQRRGANGADAGIAARTP